MKTQGLDLDFIANSDKNNKDITLAKLDELFKIMRDQNASDLHISSGAPPYLRINGDMVTLNYRNLNPEECQALIFEILTDRQKKLFVDTWELDCTYAVPNQGRVRVNVFMQRKGVGAVFRFIPDKIKSVQELSLPPQVLELIDAPKGLILVTGPTGSGKSTTLAALIDHINQTQQSHILTVEDPIEFVYENKACLINQREVSSHTKSFANALKAALREDPDIILVGEMRDLETIQLAITAAETGHLVFGTLHTNNAAKTVDRVIDVFPEAQQEQIRVMLSESLRGVIAQTLLKTIKPGRAAALEILITTPAISNLIREGKTFQIPSIMQTGRGSGMLTFENSIGELVQKRIVSQEEANTYIGKKPTLPGVTGPTPTAVGTKPAVPPVPGKKPA